VLCFQGAAAPGGSLSAEDFLEMDRRGGHGCGGRLRCVGGLSATVGGGFFMSLRGPAGVRAPTQARTLRGKCKNSFKNKKPPARLQTAFELPQTPVRTLM